MTRLSDELLRMVGELRSAGVSVSVAETLDAMRAVAAAGFSDRRRLGETLAATLVKDEADRPLFDEVFLRFFGAGTGTAREAGRPGAHRRLAGAGGGRGEQGGSERPRPDRARSEPSPGGGAASAAPRRDDPETPERPAAASTAVDARKAATPSVSRDSSRATDGGEQRAGTGAANDAAGPGTPITDRDDGERPGLEASRQTALRKVRRTPFAVYTDLEYEAARGALAPLARRFRIRLGRRLCAAPRGRVDFRRSIRSSLQRGGAILDLKMRARRPRHIELLILADVSGSVRYCSNMMLELVAGAQRCFHRVHSFVFIDRLAEAEFAGGHVAMEPVLDMYARSDFGRVLRELWERRGELVTRATLIVILGDGRNNRRPARADLMRDLRRHCRALVWLSPEPRERWGTGDSAIYQYARETDAVYEIGDLDQLERALERSIRNAV